MSVNYRKLTTDGGGVNYDFKLQSNHHHQSKARWK